MCARGGRATVGTDPRREVDDEVGDAAVRPGPGEGTRLRNPITNLVFKLEASQCGDATNVFEIEAATGAGPPLHFHESQDEWLYVLDGTFRFRIDDDVVPAPTGTFMFLPRGAPHTWQNIEGRPGSLLGAFVPPALETFFKRFSTLSKEDVTMDAFRTIARDDGMIVVGPPLSESHPPTSASD
jgi:quercetin dioxygenase-like cupin family protein